VLGSWRWSFFRSPTPVIFLNGQRYGNELALLREFDVCTVLEIRYFASLQAQTKWGSGFLGGVIQLVTQQPNQ
jgi:hypothetical protein